MTRERSAAGIRESLPSMTGRSEALEVGREGAETLEVEQGGESPVYSARLMEEIVSRENLLRALDRVRRNKGSAGVDRMTVRQLPRYLREHWRRIKEELLEGTYRPQPVLRVEIAKPDGGKRGLGIPTVLDRFIQQAILQVLQPTWDPTFSDHSYGFRPGRSCHQAVKKAQQYVKDGYTYVVDLDLASFFDEVCHDRLMQRLSERIEDKRVLKLIRSYLVTGVLHGGLQTVPEKGTPQGGPLSPFLSNVVLDEFDKELERRKHRFVRYADDSNMYVRSEKAARRLMASVTRFITRTLKLKVNETKSAVDRPWNRKFLGFRVSIRNRIALASRTIERFKAKARILTGRTGGKSLREVIAALTGYLRGWLQYFRLADIKQDFKDLDGWLRRKLRCMIWKQWKTPKRRYRELRRSGVRVRIAWDTVKSGHGPWRISRTPAVNQTLSARFFATLGLPSLTLHYRT